MGGFAGFQITRVAGSYPLVFGDNYLATLIGDVKTRNFAAQALGHKFHLCTAVHQSKIVIDKEICQDGLMVETNRLQQNRDRHLSTTVNAEIENVFGIKLEVEPRAAVRNDPG